VLLSLICIQIGMLKNKDEHSKYTRHTVITSDYRREQKFCLAGFFVNHELRSTAILLRSHPRSAPSITSQPSVPEEPVLDGLNNSSFWEVAVSRGTLLLHSHRPLNFESECHGSCANWGHPLTGKQ
jgi:hypothetical protein